jgi:hypothetical protein
MCTGDSHLDLCALPDSHVIACHVTNRRPNYSTKSTWRPGPRSGRVKVRRLVEVSDRVPHVMGYRATSAQHPRCRLGWSTNPELHGHYHKHGYDVPVFEVENSIFRCGRIHQVRLLTSNGSLTCEHFGGVDVDELAYTRGLIGEVKYVSKTFEYDVQLWQNCGKIF